LKNDIIHVSVGNLNIDIAIYVDSIPGPDESAFARDLDIRPGGAATNYAVAAAQYGHSVFLVASVSKEPLAQSALKLVEKYGVKTNYVKLVDEPPGVVLVVVYPSGERSMIRYQGANRLLNHEDVSDNLIREAHVVHFASVPPSLVERVVRRARRYSVIVTYDPGGFINEVLPEHLEGVTTLFLNERELESVKNRFKVETLIRRGLQIIAIKRGARGAMVLESSGDCYSGVSTPIRRPVDSTGAGDAFDAFFNAKYIEAKNPFEALRYALAAGALKTGYRGSFLLFDKDMFQLQLERTVVERSRECLDILGRSS